MSDQDIPKKCHRCDYSTTVKGHMKKHIESIHEGMLYPCALCEHNANDKSNLARHQQSKHRVEKYHRYGKYICVNVEAICLLFSGVKFENWNINICQ